MHLVPFQLAASETGVKPHSALSQVCREQEWDREAACHPATAHLSGTQPLAAPVPSHGCDAQAGARLGPIQETGVQSSSLRTSVGGPKPPKPCNPEAPRSQYMKGFKTPLDPHLPST